MCLCLKQGGTPEITLDGKLDQAYNPGNPSKAAIVKYDLGEMRFIDHLILNYT